MTGRLRLAALTLACGWLANGCAPGQGGGSGESEEEEEEVESGGKQLAGVQPCGAALAEVDGVWAYSNGNSTGSLSSCTGEDMKAFGLEYQCVELAQRYFANTFGTQSVWYINVAKEMCGWHPAGTDVFYAGSGYQPRRGDLAVWKDTGAGHVAVVRSSFPGGIEIIEQNSSAAGVRVLEGDAYGGYWSGGRQPACFVTAGGSPSADPGPSSGTGGGGGPAPAASSAAGCDELGYAGACVGAVAQWSEAGSCQLRDCGAAGESCGWVSDAIGYGCIGGNDGTSKTSCASLAYEGACYGNVLAFAEGESCNVLDCGWYGQSCAWNEALGYDCE